MRVTIVHNPKAGERTHGREWLLKQIEACGHQPEYFSSEDDSWQLHVNDVELVAIAGGDGSINRVARHVAGSGVLLGVLPFGTANNGATKLGLTEFSTEALIASWTRARRQRFDIGVARGAWGTSRFVESVGLGLLAEGMLAIECGSAKYINDLSDREARMAAALELFQRELQECRPRTVQLRVDDEDLSGEFLMVEVLNFGAAGPNLHLSPAAQASDGLLDVVVVGEATRRDLLALLPRAREIPESLHRLPVRRGRRVVLRCPDAVLHVDDRLWRPPRPGTAEVPGDIELTIEPGALTFLVPAG